MHYHLSNKDEMITNALLHMIENQYGYACNCLAVGSEERMKLWQHSLTVLGTVYADVDLLENKQVADFYRTLISKIRKAIDEVVYKNPVSVSLPIFRKLYDHNNNRIFPNKRAEYKRLVKGFYKEYRESYEWRNVFCDTIYDMAFTKEYIFDNGLVIYDFNNAVSVFGWIPGDKQNSKLPFVNKVLETCPLTEQTLNFFTKKCRMNPAELIRFLGNQQPIGA